MILLFLLCCSTPERKALPQKRQPAELISHRIQYGKLKGHLFKRGAPLTEAYIIVATKVPACLPNAVANGQTVLVIQDERDKESAKDYLTKQASGAVKLADTTFFCREQK